MPETATPRTDTKAQLPVPIGKPQTLTVNSQTYSILRFDEGVGPDLAQTKAIAKNMGKEMLTLYEAREIRDNKESNIAFKNALQLGDFGYVTDPKSEEESLAACLFHSDGGFGFFAYVVQHHTARVVVLKETYSGAAVPQAQVNEIIMSIQRPKSVSSPQQIQERISEVFFTDKAVRSPYAYASVPKGCRMARPDEVALAYKEKPEFREALNALPCAVWVDKTGWGSYGPHRIIEYGKFKRIDYSKYKLLEAKDRSWHYPGPGLVALLGDDGKYRKLTVYGSAEPDYAARVAYVTLEEDHAQNLAVQIRS